MTVVESGSRALCRSGHGGMRSAQVGLLSGKEESFDLEARTGIVTFLYQQPFETAVQGSPGALRRPGHGDQGRPSPGSSRSRCGQSRWRMRLRSIARSRLVGSASGDDSPGRDERVQDGALEVEQRPQDRSAAAVDPLEPGESAPRGDAKEEGLDLVVPVVGGKDPVGADPRPKRLERRVPHPPRRRLAALPPSCGLRHRVALRGEGQPELRRDRRRARRPVARARVEPMVDMKEVEGDSVPRRELAEAHRQRRRIAPAREGHDPGPPRAGRELGGEEGVESLEHHASAAPLLEPEGAGTEDRQRRAGCGVEEIGVAGDERRRASGQGRREDRFVIRVAKHDGGVQVRLGFEEVGREGREDLRDERFREADLVAQHPRELVEDLPADDQLVLREDQAEQVTAQPARGVGRHQHVGVDEDPQETSRKMSSSVRYPRASA